MTDEQKKQIIEDASKICDELGSYKDIPINEFHSIELMWCLLKLVVSSYDHRLSSNEEVPQKKG